MRVREYHQVHSKDRWLRESHPDHCKDLRARELHQDHSKDRWLRESHQDHRKDRWLRESLMLQLVRLWAISTSRCNSLPFRGVCPRACATYTLNLWQDCALSW